MTDRSPERLEGQGHFRRTVHLPERREFTVADYPNSASLACVWVTKSSTIMTDFALSRAGRTAVFEGRGGFFLGCAWHDNYPVTRVQLFNDPANGRPATQSKLLVTTFVAR